MTRKDCGKKSVRQSCRSFEKRYKELLLSLKNNNYNFKSSQLLLETGHAFSKIDDIMKILHCNKKGQHLDTIKDITSTEKP